MTAVERYQASAQAWLSERPDSERSARTQALAAFVERGFPVRDEDWKYTDLAAFLAETFSTPPTDAPSPFSAEVLTGIDRAMVQGDTRLVFVDGRYAKNLSAVASGLNITPCSLQAAHPVALPAAVDAFGALNHSLWSDGASIVVESDAKLASTIHVVHISTRPQAQSHLRHTISLARGSSASVVEHYCGLTSAPVFVNCTTDISLAEGAKLSYSRIQHEREATFHVGTVTARLASGANLHSVQASVGSRLSRVRMRVDLAEEEASVHLAGVFATQGVQVSDVVTQVMHTAPHCQSSQVFRGVAKDQSRGVFTGRVRVEVDAQKTQAAQSCKTLLLSPEAVTRARPQLEIYADDVRCTHGATVGQLDPESLFYLRSRGLDLASAKELLTQAFVSEAWVGMSDTTLRAALEKTLAQEFFHEGSA